MTMEDPNERTFYNSPDWGSLSGPEQSSALADWKAASLADQAKQAWLRENMSWLYSPEELANPRNLWGTDYDPTITAADYTPTPQEINQANAGQPTTTTPLVLNEGEFFTCSICGGQFTTEYDLQSHLYTAHGKSWGEVPSQVTPAYTTPTTTTPTTIPTDPTRPYKCPICGQGFSTDQELQIHVWGVHSQTSQTTPPVLGQGKSQGEGLIILGILGSLILAVQKRSGRRKK